MHLKSTKIDLMFKKNVEESTSTKTRRSTTGGWTAVGEDIDLQRVLRWSSGQSSSIVRIRTLVNPFQISRFPHGEKIQDRNLHALNGSQDIGVKCLIFILEQENCSCFVISGSARSSPWLHYIDSH
ncbi:hypothetical protein NC653_035227 [Populus alba x Populus x berolinensis]|uniref:Uncharacterized protein n=1 Tax=Populus alba x Populus x berolinensis TaxID=444605 RepID=A0AAD6LQ03_9ROSI|nr:hypothetical protein NC653_035227 [Populus alba x Populus x berolinensis]